MTLLDLYTVYNLDMTPVEESCISRYIKLDYSSVLDCRVIVLDAVAQLLNVAGIDIVYHQLLVALRCTLMQITNMML